MSNIIHWGLIVIALLLSISILLQHKSASLGAAFGGSGNSYSSKRGIEKFLMITTVVLAVTFFSGAIASLFFQ